MTAYLPIAALLLSGVAALLGIRAATMKVRDNQDAFIADLQRQGRWASYAAIAATAGRVAEWLRQRS
jgi:hypothetical protein